MLTVRDVARTLKVSPSCIYQLIHQGKLPCHRIGVGRGAIRISQDDLDSFLNDSKCELPEAEQWSVKHLKHLRL